MTRTTETTVLLADDHPVFRLGLRQVIEAAGGYRVIAETGDGRSALAQVGLLEPDFAILDLNMPVLDGFALLEILTERSLRTRPLIVSMYAETGYARKARALGAIGFVAKEDAAHEIARALTVAEGEFYMSESVGAPTAAPLRAGASGEDTLLDLDSLTSAERRVMQLLSNGKTSKEIGLDLEVSPRTVHAHRRNIARKLGVTGPNRLLEIAIRHRDRFAAPPKG